jgi:heterodisulfide reductase subunit A
MTTANQDKTAVLVVGGGIAGMAASMHLAELGHPVQLLDTAPAIGGSLHLLDHTFPTNSCGICLMLPRQPAFCPTFECELATHVSLLPYAELLALTGEPGHFQARVHHKTRYVDAAKCTGCGDCATVCPEARPHDHEGWLSPVKAIYRPPGLRAVPDTWLIDPAVCTRCGACVEACPTGAIDLAMADREEELQVGAVLLTPGFAPFDARLKGEYGYGLYDNVLSSLEFERLVSLAGSRVAHLVRPSDGSAPRHIAFVQCVGSRDPLCGAGHCSSACCMYTAKQVALAKKLDPGLQATVFFMDTRAFGKDFEAYLDTVMALPGVTYRRAMPSSLHQVQQSRDLLLTYAGENGQLQEETFDLVVLALGFAPPPGLQKLARSLGLELNELGFARSDPYRPTHTNQPGIFVAGAFREPKDIPETVAEAAGAAAEVSAFLHQRLPGHRPGLPRPQEAATPLRDVTDEAPRIGVFVCECNGDLASIDGGEVLAWARQQPGVALARPVTTGCSPEGQAAIQEAIRQEGLNRVVLGGCSQRLFGREFETLMEEVGLDPRLLARVNLREQLVYAHAPNRNQLTRKAQSLVGMAVAEMRLMAGLEALSLGGQQTLRRRALVVGGGAAGLTAALALARLEVPVVLVERTGVLGGQWRQIHYQAGEPGSKDSEPQAALETLLAQVQGEARIQVRLETQLVESTGQPGQYRSTLVTGEQTELVEHGVLVVATGGRPTSTTEYLYGQDPRVLTQRELEQQLAEGTVATVQTVVMIQCVGSREPQRPYCSRVCCTQAVKNALKLKAHNPALNVYVLYREMRTYGFREASYQAARDAGVVFVRYELPEKPQISTTETRNGLLVKLREPVTGLPLEIQAGLVILSVGVEPEEERELAQTLGVSLNRDGFFQEEQAKMKPLDLGSGRGAGGGIFVAGLAHSPRFLEETIAQAQGAAMRAAAFLAPEEVRERPTSVWVNPRLCSFCGLCVEACPYGARQMNDDSRVADVDYVLCQGCGVCAMVCPNKATLQKTLEHRQLLAAVDMALV